MKQPIGSMREVITIQALTQGQGAQYGEPTKSWADWAVVYANVYDGPGRELEAARQQIGEVVTQFQIRWAAGLSVTMRILFNGLIYDIQRIVEFRKENRWDIYATARRP